MKIIRFFENAASLNVIHITLDELFDTLINQYYCENKVISTASSSKKENA